MIHDGDLPTDVCVMIGTGEIHRQLRTRQEKQIIDPRQQQIKLVGHGVFKVSETAIEAKDDGIAGQHGRMLAKELSHVASKDIANDGTIVVRKLSKIGYRFRHFWSNEPQIDLYKPRKQENQFFKGIGLTENTFFGSLCTSSAKNIDGFVLAQGFGPIEGPASR